MSLKPALILVAGTALMIAGCGQGSLDSGVTAAGSGQASPNSGAAGSVPTTPTPSTTR